MILKNVDTTNALNLHIQDIRDEIVDLVYNTNQTVPETKDAVQSYLVGDLARLIAASKVSVIEGPAVDVGSSMTVGAVTISSTVGVSSAVTLTGFGTAYKVLTTKVSGPAAVVSNYVTQSSGSFIITVTDSTGAVVNTTAANAIVNYVAFKTTI